MTFSLMECIFPPFFHHFAPREEAWIAALHSGCLGHDGLEGFSGRISQPIITSVKPQ